MKKHTVDEVRAAVEFADSCDLPDGAWFQMIHDYLGVEVGDISDQLSVVFEQSGEDKS